MIVWKDIRSRLWIGFALIMMILAMFGAARSVFAGGLTGTTTDFSLTAAAPPAPLAPRPLAPEANVVVNGDFETGSLIPNWATFTQGTGTIVTSATGFVHAGTYAAKIVNNSSGTGDLAGGGSCSGGSRIPVSSSTSYDWSGFIYVPSTVNRFNNAFVRIAWYSVCAGGTAISTSDSTLVSSGNDAWTQVSGGVPVSVSIGVEVEVGV